jgi:radical SAM enzyme (TIGR01210 family)
LRYSRVKHMARDRFVSKVTPEAVWKEDDQIEGRKVRAMVLILRTTGCWWSKKKGCLMCGYNQASVEGIGPDELRSQLNAALGSYECEEMVKIYTSGSFLDENEIPAQTRGEIFIAFANAKRVLFETRPEFVTAEAINTLPQGKVTVALGLESANDTILRSSVRKGFSVADYARAATLLRDAGIPVRTYLLLKPPFLTERQAIADTLASIEYAVPFSESISINPINVQRGTAVESLWRRGDYRPPWLWSLLEVLERGRKPGVRVFSSPSGGGTPRGVHNCERCNQAALAAVEKFAFSQDAADLQIPDCPCKNEWKAAVALQDAMHTSVDLARHLGDELELD